MPKSTTLLHYTCNIGKFSTSSHTLVKFVITANLEENLLASCLFHLSILVQYEGSGCMPKRAVNQSFPVMEKMLFMNNGITLRAHPPPTALVPSQQTWSFVTNVTQLYTRIVGKGNSFENC